jgi:hypothetical protein
VTRLEFARLIQILVHKNQTSATRNQNYRGRSSWPSQRRSSSLPVRPPSADSTKSYAHRAAQALPVARTFTQRGLQNKLPQHAAQHRISRTSHLFSHCGGAAPTPDIGREFTHSVATSDGVPTPSLPPRPQAQRARVRLGIPHLFDPCLRGKASEGNEEVRALGHQPCPCSRPCSCSCSLGYFWVAPRRARHRTAGALRAPGPPSVGSAWLRRRGGPTVRTLRCGLPGKRCHSRCGKAGRARARVRQHGDSPQRAVSTSGVLRGAACVLGAPPQIQSSASKVLGGTASERDSARGRGSRRTGTGFRGAGRTGSAGALTSFDAALRT